MNRTHTIEKQKKGIDSRITIVYNDPIQGTSVHSGAAGRGLHHETVFYANVHVRELPLVLFVLRRLTFAYVSKPARKYASRAILLVFLTFQSNHTHLKGLYQSCLNKPHRSLRSST